MTKCKAIFILMTFLIVVGCTAGTTSTKSGTSPQPKGTINCAKIEPYTAEERQFCLGGRD
jgi:hypothetical protein